MFTARGKVNVYSTYLLNFTLTQLGNWAQIKAQKHHNSTAVEKPVDLTINPSVVKKKLSASTKSTLYSYKEFKVFVRSR